jgi:DNA helicase HerA-like ATPase
MADVRRELEVMAEERAAKSSAKSQRGKEKERKKTPEDHLRSKISPVLDSKVFEGRSVDVATHRPGVLRLDVSKLPWELQRLVAEFVLLQVFKREMLLGHRERVERFVVIDEAKLAMPRRGAAASQWAIVNRVVSEGRKYGIGIIMATQSAEHLTPDVRRNIGTKLLLRHDETELWATRRRFPGVEVGLLRTLDRPGVGLLVDGVGVKRIRVRGYDFRDLGR